MTIKKSPLKRRKLKIKYTKTVNKKTKKILNKK